MVSQVAYSDILKSLKERKQFEKDLAVKASEATCSSCNGNIQKNGISHISGICKNCINDSLNDIKTKHL